MDAPAQQTIVDYITGGGNAVIYPCLPDRELSQKPCTLLRDAISISPSGTEVIDSPLIDMLGFRDIKCSNPQITFSEESYGGGGDHCADHYRCSVRIRQDSRKRYCNITSAHGSDSTRKATNRFMRAILKRSGAKLRQRRRTMNI